MRTPFALLLAALVGGTLLAAEPKPSPTLMTKPGKLLYSEDFAKPLDASWKVGKGKWDSASEALRGAELKADMHGAVIRRNLEMTDAIVQYSFKLEGAKVSTLSLNDSKGHVCRVQLRANGFTVQKDDHDGKDGADKAVVLETVETPIKTGEWHALSVEFRGTEMLACLDGKHVAYGQHEQVKLPKTNFGLTVAGETASFKELRVWAAEADPTWDPKSLKKAK